MAKDQETEQHKQVSVKLPCYFSHDGSCGGCPKPITSREFQLESWPGPVGTSPKSITSWPLQRGQQDLALASQSAPTFSGGVALILQEERGNKQEDNNSLSVHSFTQQCVYMCAFTAVPESKVSLDFSNQMPRWVQKGHFPGSNTMKAALWPVCASAIYSIGTIPQ